MLNNIDILSFVSLTDTEKDKINNKNALKPQSQSSTAVKTGEKSSSAIGQVSVVNLDQLGELAQQLLNDKDLEVSKVRPFFWSLVETYVDRFQLYPFDVKKALFSHLELHGYPKGELTALIEELEQQYINFHSQPLRNESAGTGKPGKTGKQSKTRPAREIQDTETDVLRDCLKYAGLVNEN